MIKSFIIRFIVGVIFLVLTILVLVSIVSATIYCPEYVDSKTAYWTNRGSNNKASNPDNWTGIDGNVPLAGDKVIINNNYFDADNPLPQPPPSGGDYFISSESFDSPPMIVINKVEWDLNIIDIDIEIESSSGELTAPISIDYQSNVSVTTFINDSASISVSSGIMEIQDCVKRQRLGNGVTDFDIGEECDAHECRDGKRFMTCGPSNAWTTCDVVYKNGDIPCITDNVNEYYKDYTGNGLHSALSAANYSTFRRILVCPGVYVGNFKSYRAQHLDIVAWSAPDMNVLSTDYHEVDNYYWDYSDQQYPNDTILMSPNGATTLYITNGMQPGEMPLYMRVSGFRIGGAIGDYCPVWINSDQGYESPVQVCAGIRVYCMEDATFDHNILFTNYVGFFQKDTDKYWWFGLKLYRNVAIDNKIGLWLKYGNNSTAEFWDFAFNDIGVRVTDAMFHYVGNSSFIGNNIQIQLDHEKYLWDEANQGVIIQSNNFYKFPGMANTLIDDCPNPNNCQRFFSNYIEDYWYDFNFYPRNKPYDWLRNEYRLLIDSCSLN